MKKFSTIFLLAFASIATATTGAVAKPNFDTEMSLLSKYHQAIWREEEHEALTVDRKLQDVDNGKSSMTRSNDAFGTLCDIVYNIFDNECTKKTSRRYDDTLITCEADDGASVSILASGVDSPVALQVSLTKSNGRVTNFQINDKSNNLKIVSKVLEKEVKTPGRKLQDVGETKSSMTRSEDVFRTLCDIVYSILDDDCTKTTSRRNDETVITCESGNGASVSILAAGVDSPIAVEVSLLKTNGRMTTFQINDLSNNLSNVAKVLQKEVHQ